MLDIEINFAVGQPFRIRFDDAGMAPDVYFVLLSEGFQPFGKVFPPKRQGSRNDGRAEFIGHICGRGAGISPVRSHVSGNQAAQHAHAPVADANRRYQVVPYEPNIVADAQGPGSIVRAAKHHVAKPDVAPQLAVRPDADVVADFGIAVCIDDAIVAQPEIVADAQSARSREKVVVIDGSIIADLEFGSLHENIVVKNTTVADANPIALKPDIAAKADIAADFHVTRREIRPSEPGYYF